MPRRHRAVDTWKEMKGHALRQLALAAFIVFGVSGPLSVLMESKIHLVSWRFVIVETIATGGLAASIIFFGRRRWWAIAIITVAFSALMLINSGGLSFVFDEHGMRVSLGEEMGVQDVRPTDQEPQTFSPELLQSIYTQRGVLGVGALAMLALGSTLFFRVINSEVQHRTRLEAEVNIAKDIQESLIPDEAPKIGWVDVSGRMIPATEVGGDIYDVVQVAEHQLAVAVADVAGHGVGAGILSAMLKSALRLQLQHDASPVAVLKHINNTIYDVSDEKTFVTFAYLLLDRNLKAAFLATAGHPPILHLEQNPPAVRWHRDSTPALGMRKNVQFSFRQIPLRSGDRFILYTDGLLEAANAKGEQFGAERLESTARNAAGSVEDLCAELASAVREFSGRDTFEDDLTIVCAQVA